MLTKNLKTLAWEKRRKEKTILAKKERRKENRKLKKKAFNELKKLNDIEGRKRKLPQDTNGDEGSKEKKRNRSDYIYPLNGCERSSEGPPANGKLSDEQKAVLKKLLEERKQQLANRAQLNLTEVGEAALLSQPWDRRTPLNFDDFQHFIIFSLLHAKSTMGFSRWVQIKKPSKIHRRIFLLIEGAGSREYLETPKDSLRTLTGFEGTFEVITPNRYGADLVTELALVPTNKTQTRAIIRDVGSVETALSLGLLREQMRTFFNITTSNESGLPKVTAKTRDCPLPGADKFSRTLLLLSPKEMIREGYPMPAMERFSGFVMSRDDYGEVSERSPMWSVDCEMCLTQAGNELTRISIVNEQHEMIYDTLVQPPNKILNYLTQYSGITREMLADVRTTLADVQTHIRSICPPDCIFIGQSLQFDLVAMKMMHPYIIDTSLIFNLSGVVGRKSKLKLLCEEFLSEKIQCHGEAGHNPIEDSLAAMKLVQAKLQHSFEWGNAVLSGPRPAAEAEAARALLEAREEVGAGGLASISTEVTAELGKAAEAAHSSSPQLTRTLVSNLLKDDAKVLLVGKESTLQKWKSHLDELPPEDDELMRGGGLQVKSVATNKQIIRAAKTSTPDGGLTIAHVSISSPQAVYKADKLVEKLLRSPTANTLYSVLLTGSEKESGAGLLLLHLMREGVPFARLPTSAQASSSS